ncbi:bifunctional methylenetetrahydrofolate dehydrogenase/methenyltetrahydrofolate cyclohydrolase, partial [Bacillus pseudomycoides]|uniref:tetrahydrofolate dehydrogenase/cyclohydrolase catalytic domain-containing protein n=1 Tax=Bacillus pseudomycoides TaxID=64104 RepID=UPI00283ACA26
MVAISIKGNEVEEKKRKQLKGEVVKFKAQGIVPGLAVILVGEDPASRSYVKVKEKGCEQVGIYSELIEFPDIITEERLVAEIDRLDEYDRINGILVQLPLPKNIEEKALLEIISPEKDVEGFHPISF